MTPWTWHGGGLAAARAYFGDGDAPWLDLSTGINPNGWPGVESITIDWQRLPEIANLRALEAAAAGHFGTDPEYVCALPGTEIGLRLVGEMLPRPARYLAPSYRTHAEMCAGATPITPGDPDAATAATLIVANPKNPDGRVINPTELARADRWLVIDEAFGDVDPRLSAVPLLPDQLPLIIFRSFGKFFGLAGVRLGFVLGPLHILTPLRARLGAWPLSAAAIAIGTAAYRDTDWIAATRLRLAQSAAALDAVLARHGLKATGSCPLFRLIETDQAAELFERLARRAILTRPFAEQPHWLRIGLPRDPAALERLDRALGDG
jgi:cobalamin biosynthetic protein CobC